MSRLSTCGDKPVNIPEQECSSCSGLESRVSSLEDCCDEAKESISSLNGDMGAVKQTVDALNDSTDNLKDQVEDLQQGKQNLLTPGNNITIVDDIISAVGAELPHVEAHVVDVATNDGVSVTGYGIEFDTDITEYVESGAAVILDIADYTADAFPVRFGSVVVPFNPSASNIADVPIVVRSDDSHTGIFVAGRNGEGFVGLVTTSGSASGGGDNIRIETVASMGLHFSQGEVCIRYDLQLPTTIEELLRGGTLVDIKTQYTRVGSANSDVVWFGETFGVTDGTDALNPVVNQDVDTVRFSMSLQMVVYRQIVGNINYQQYPNQDYNVTVFFVIHD